MDLPYREPWLELANSALPMPPPHGVIQAQDHVQTGCRVTPTLRIKETIIMIQTLELVIKEHPFFHGLSDEHLDFIT